MMDHTKPDTGVDSDLSVVDRVLTEFTEAVAGEDGYADVAKRLRIALLEKRDVSEAALERALFDVEQS